MHADEYARMHAVEKEHWWYHGLHQMVLTRLRSESEMARRRGNPAPRILDAGCGTGAVANLLASLGSVTAMDFSTDALRFCHADQVPAHLVAGSVNALPFASAAFDVVVSLDVLCHRSVDDAGALREMARVLRPPKAGGKEAGGLLLLNLPAYNWLRGRHDVVVHTARRYDQRSASALLAQAGFRVEWMSYWNTLLFPVAALVRLASRRRVQSDAAHSDVGPVRPALNQALKRILAAERALLSDKKGAQLPFGLSVMVAGRRVE